MGGEQGWWDTKGTWQGPGGHENLTLVCCRLLCNRGNRVHMEVIHVRVACLWILSAWVAAQWGNWCGTRIMYLTVINKSDLFFT